MWVLEDFMKDSDSSKITEEGFLIFKGTRNNQVTSILIFHGRGLQQSIYYWIANQIQTIMHISLYINNDHFNDCPLSVI